MKRIYVLVMGLLLLSTCACAASGQKSPSHAAMPTVQNTPAAPDLPDVQTQYLTFLQDTLVPRYGLSNLSAVRYLQQSSEPLRMDEQCLGLMSALMADLDEDGINELIVAVCTQKQTVRGPDQVVSAGLHLCGGATCSGLPDRRTRWYR